MKQIKLTTGEYLLVEVPEDASDFATHWSDDIQKLVFTSNIQDPLKCGGDILHLPSGQWEIIGKASELSEEQWKGIVESFVDDETTGRDYYYKYPDKEGGYLDPTESGLSLIKSHSMNPETTLVIRKIKTKQS